MITSGKDAKNIKHAKDYFRDVLEKDDYYLDGQDKILGEWQGKEIKKLGLSDEIKKRDYYKVLENQKPDGSRLTPRTDKDRRIFLDFTFSVPKSVSVAYELAGEEKGDKRLLEACQNAVSKTVELMEQDAEVRSRISKKGIKTGNLLCAKFTHFHSRPLDDGKPDPQMHMHCLVINASYDQRREKWYAVDLGKLKGNANGKYQPYFWKSLREEVEKLGYKTRDNGRNFEIEGISKEIIGKFSRRGNEIDEKAEEKGLNAKQKAKLAVENRNKKNDGVAQTDLHKYWYDKLTDREKEALRNLVNNEGEAQNRKAKDTQAQLEQKIQENQKKIKDSNLQNTTSLSSQQSLSRNKQSSINRESTHSKVNVKGEREGMLTLERARAGDIQAGQVVYSKNKLDSSKPMGGGYTIESVDNKKNTVRMASNFNNEKKDVTKSEAACFERYNKKYTEFKKGDVVQITQSGKGKRQIGTVSKGETFEVLKPATKDEGMHLKSTLDRNKSNVILDKNYGYLKKVADAKDKPNQPNQVPNEKARGIVQDQQMAKTQQQQENAKSFAKQELARQAYKQQNQRQQIVQQQAVKQHQKSTGRER